MSPPSHTTVSMDLSIDYEQCNAAEEVEEQAFDSVSLEIEGYDAEYIDFPEAEPPPKVYAADAPPPAKADAEAELESASYRAITRRARVQRESQIRPGRPKSATLDGLQRVVAWCVVALAAAGTAALVVKKPWAVAAVLLLSSTILAALHGSKSLSDGRPQKKQLALQSSVLRMVVAWPVAILLSQILPVSYVFAAPLSAALLLCLALGLFCYAWLAPALLSYRVSKPVVLVLVAAVFTAVHFAAMLSVGASPTLMQFGMSLVLGAAYTAVYAARPKAIEITVAFALQMFVCQL